MLAPAHLVAQADAPLEELQHQRRPGGAIPHRVAPRQQQQRQSEDRGNGGEDVKAELKGERANDDHPPPSPSRMLRKPVSARRYLWYSASTWAKARGDVHQRSAWSRSGKTGWATMRTSGMARENSSRLRGM